MNKQPRYNLNVVLKETGIKADTLRAWERRYQLPRPIRTEGGHRVFSDYDIETIKWLSERQAEGMSISHAVDLWREIESSGIDPLSSSRPTQSINVSLDLTIEEGEGLAHMRNEWVQACLDFDESRAEQVLTQSFAQFSLETVCTEILQSGLAQIGGLWYQAKASVQQEHFASEIAMRRLHSLIAAAPQPIRSRTILVGCPQGENHTFSALLLSLLLRYRGWHVTYLGANVPQVQIIEPTAKIKPDLVVMTSMRLATASALFENALALKAANIPLAFGGRIFSFVPEMAGRVPGHFLGPELLGAVPKIESLLASPLPETAPMPSAGLWETLRAKYIEKQQLIEMQTLETLKEKMGPQIPLANIHDANIFLAQDILAALTLGDITLIHSNLEWVEGLIINFQIPIDIFSHYLAAYQEAIQTHLDLSGTPSQEWFSPIINRMMN